MTPRRTGEAGGLAYIESAPDGEELPIVIVHGAGGNAGAWGEVLDGLPRAWAVDLPGRGASAPAPPYTVARYAEAVGRVAQAAARRFDAPGAIVAGHSMGGAVAIELALGAPGGLAGIALMGSGGRLRVTQAILEFTAGLASGDDLRPFLRAGFAPGADEKRVAALAALVADSMPVMGHADFRACDAFDRLDDLGRVRCPALVVCGDADPLTPPKFSRRLARDIPGARLTILEGVGHMIEAEAPAAVAEALEGFRRELADCASILNRDRANR